MTNINSAACVAPMNLIALALLATPKQSMLETDLGAAAGAVRVVAAAGAVLVAGVDHRRRRSSRSCGMASAWASCSGTSIRSATCCR
jgi:hypothetical protein